MVSELRDPDRGGSDIGVYFDYEDGTTDGGNTGQERFGYDNIPASDCSVSDAGTFRYSSLCDGIDVVSRWVCDYDVRPQSRLKPDTNRYTIVVPNGGELSDQTVQFDNHTRTSCDRLALADDGVGTDVDNPTEL